jgi:hypothetical protein
VSYLIIAFFFGLAGGIAGRVKGSSFVLWFLVSACLPVIGLLAAVAYRSDREELRRRCPQCGKVVKLYDQLCTCGAELYFPDAAVESEAASVRRALRAGS